MLGSSSNSIFGFAMSASPIASICVHRRRGFRQAVFCAVPGPGRCRKCVPSRPGQHCVLIEPNDDTPQKKIVFDRHGFEDMSPFRHMGNAEPDDLFGSLRVMSDSPKITEPCSDR